MVADRDRLGALKMRVAGHPRLGFLLGTVEDDQCERSDRLHRLQARVGDVEAERGRDLVVPRAAGMDPAADVAEQALNGGVDILVLGDEVFGTDGGERLFDLGELGIVEQSGGVEPTGVKPRRLDVVRE